MIRRLIGGKPPRIWQRAFPETQYGMIPSCQRSLEAFVVRSFNFVLCAREKAGCCGAKAHYEQPYFQFCQEQIVGTARFDGLVARLHSYGYMMLHG